MPDRLDDAALDAIQAQCDELRHWTNQGAALDRAIWDLRALLAEVRALRDDRETLGTVAEILLAAITNAESVDLVTDLRWLVQQRDRLAAQVRTDHEHDVREEIHTYCDSEGEYLGDETVHILVCHSCGEVTDGDTCAVLRDLGLAPKEGDAHE